ncbi:MAG: uroporphyrinogen decarboxylase family protein [Anaerolineae bacterium]
MSISERENWLRTVEFRNPEWIPCYVGLAPILFKLYRQDLEQLIAAHPRIFPDYKQAQRDYDWMPPAYHLGEYYRDNWGCVWHNIQEGIEGQVVGHPLADWSALDSWRPPDPHLFFERSTVDWDQMRSYMAEQLKLGKLRNGSGERLFDRLYALRGFDALMMDFATEAPELTRLIEILTEHELALIQLWLELGVDAISFHTDIGTQRGLMISPASFRKYIKPMFMTLFRSCRAAGVHVNLSSDGRLIDIIDDLLECGVSIHDPQLRANGLADIKRAYQGRLCINLDLDRQSFPFITPAEMRAQVREVVDTLALSEGGLMMLAQFYGADIPLANIAACLEAMEDYCF